VPEPGSRRSAAGLAGIGVVAVLISATLSGPIASAVRKLFAAVTPNRFLILLGLVFVASLGAVLARRGRVRSPAGRSPPGRFLWPVPVGAIAAVAGVVWYSLGRASVVPRIFGDELTHGEAARSLAQHGTLTGTGYGVVTPVVDAIAYLTTSNDYTAYRGVQVLNVVVAMTAAFLAYPLARRALSPRWSLVVAALTVALPWLTYARFVLTEADFYPAFLLFALTLVRALEHPTWKRQLLVAAALALTYLTRTQAVTLAGAVLVAVPIYGIAQGRLRATLKAFAPTWALYGTAGAVLLVAAASGAWSPLGPYRPLLDGFRHPHGLAIWIAANLATLTLGLGILTGVAAPLGVATLLRRRATPGAAALAAVTISATAALLISVSLLSESVYGQGSVHERDLFFAAPLLISCALAWAAHGFPRPKVVTAVTAVASVGFAASIPRGAIDSHVVDALSFKLWAQISLGHVSPGAWITAATAAGALVVVTARSTWPLVLTIALAAVGVAAASDYRSVETPSQAHGYTWVDRSAPARAEVTVLYVGYPQTACPPGTPTSPLATMSLYTEYFNARVDQVGHLLGDNAARGVASTPFALRPDGVVTSGGQPLRPEYLVTDARIAIAGTRLASLPAGKVTPEPVAKGALTLWRVRSPLRLLQPAQVEHPQQLACG
jgi:Dolichyl-phosphate-mannose-protein mannosyltransferase